MQFEPISPFALFCYFFLRWEAHRGITTFYYNLHWITVAICKRCHIQCIILHDWSYYRPIGVFIREGLLALLAGIPTWIITFCLAEIPFTVSLPFPSSSCSSLTLGKKNVSVVNPVKLFLETSVSVKCYRMKCTNNIWDLCRGTLIFLHGSHH